MQAICSVLLRTEIDSAPAYIQGKESAKSKLEVALYYPLSASLILVTNILSNPQDQHAASDINLMNSITWFISHFVQPGTSFAATPTLSLFKTLYSIVTRLVAKVPPQSSQKMKRQPESDDHAQSDFISSSRVRLVPDSSSCSDLNISASFVPHDSTTIFSETDINASRSSPVYSGQHIREGDQDVQSTNSSPRSQEFTGNIPLEFAPFVPPEPSQFDYDPATSGFQFSPTRFDWDMPNMWMPSLPLDPWASADHIGMPDDTNIDPSKYYFNENDDGSNTYQQ